VAAEARVVLELHAQCLAASSTSHLKVMVMRVADPRLFENSSFGF
jgi:hypothetical protein